MMKIYGVLFHTSKAPGAKVQCFRGLTWIVVFATLLISFSAFSVTGISVQGRILRPDGNPVTGSKVQFRIQIRSPGAENCLLYEESQELDMSKSSGLFSLTVGSGTRSAASVDGGFSLERVFANRGAFDLSSTSSSACAIGTAYIPSPTDKRRLVYQFNEGASWQNVPELTINWVPLAIESLQVGGFRADQLLRVADGAGNPAAAPVLSPSQAIELMNLINGNSVQYVTPGAAVFSAAPKYSGVVSTNDDLTNKSYVDNAINSVISTALPDLGTSGTYYKVVTDAKGRVISGATSLIESDLPSLVTAGKVDGGAINAGTIGGSTSINTSGNILTSGTVSANTISGNQLRVYNGSNYIQFTAPTLGGNLNFNLPPVDGAPGEVLKTDGAGNLSWMPSTTGSVTNVATSAPLSSSGGQTPTISISQSNATTDGYLSSADWNTFNNKLSTTTNFSGDVSGTYNSISVDKIKGTAVSISGLGSGQFLRHNGSAWVNTTLSASDIPSLDTSKITTGVLPVARGGTGAGSFTSDQMVIANATGSSLVSFSCTNGQVLGFSALGAAQCENVNGAGLVLRLDGSGKIADSMLPSTALTTSTSFSGDVSGTYNSTSVDRIKGTSLSISSLSSGNFLKYNGSAWVNSDLSASDIVSGTLPVTRGGTGISSYTAGDMLYATGATTLSSLGIGANGTILSSNGSAPTWTTLNSLGFITKGGNTFGSSVSIGTNDSFNLNFRTSGSERVTIDTAGNFGIGTLSPGSTLDIAGALSARGISAPALAPAGQGRIYFDSSANKFRISQNGGAYADLATGGTVTSVQVALPSEFTVSGGPVTTAGTITGSWASQTANKVFASPDAISGAPSFRALVANDIPSLDTGKLSSGVLPIARGGTNNGSLPVTAGGVIYTDGSKMMNTGAGTTGQALISAGASAPAFGTLGVVGGGTGLTSYTAGDLLFASGATSISKLGIGASGTILSSNGSAPTWSTLNSLGFITNGGNTFASAISIGTNDSFNLFLETGGSSRMAIDTSGLVGVGTIAPSVRLDVNGTLKVANGGETCSVAANGGMIRYTSNSLQFCNGSTWTTLGTTTGTVTSVQVALPSEFTVSGGPVTTVGTITGSWASQTANKVFASPDAISGTPSFRALVANDIPSLDAAKIGTGVLPIARGGTGISSFTAGDLMYASSSSAIARLEIGASGTILTSNGSSPTWSTGNSLGIFVNGGNSFGGAAILGTNDANSLSFETNGTSQMTIDSSGNVGVGVAPTANLKLDVAGQLRSVYTTTNTVSIDFSRGNTQYFSGNCSGSVNLTNMAVGASYTLIVTDTSTTACTFQDAGTTIATGAFVPSNGPRISGKRTIYEFIKVSSSAGDVMVSWIPGFN